MLLLISPAKTLDFSPSPIKKYTDTSFTKDSKELVKVLKKKSADDLKQLMGVSDKIAELNVDRFKSFKTPFDLNNAKQAVLAFRGDVYTGLDADSFDEADLEFAQEHLRILSGLYGILKPLDLMQPYRLEMGTKLQNSRGKNLYEFWHEKITNRLNEDLQATNSEYIINLASKEYFKSVKPKLLNGKLININFKEDKNGTYKIVAFFAKKARGMMCHYIIKNKITNPEHLKGFDYDNYVYNEDLSTEKELIFTR